MEADALIEIGIRTVIIKWIITAINRNSIRSTIFYAAVSETPERITNHMYSQNREDYFEEFFTEISSILEDLCQSGFHTVHDSTLQELGEKSDTAAQCGMRHLSELLNGLREELSANRHRISVTKSADSLSAKYYTNLVKYMELGMEKTAYDRGKNYYLNENGGSKQHTQKV